MKSLTFLGETIFNLESLIETTGQEIELDVKKGDNQYEKFGLVKVKAQENQENYQFIKFTASIDNSLFNSQEIMLKIYNKRNFEDWKPIYITKGIRHSEVNASWEPVELAKYLLYHEGIENKLKFEVLLYNKKTKKIRVLTNLSVSTNEIVKDKKNKFVYLVLLLKQLAFELVGTTLKLTSRPLLFISLFSNESLQ